MTTPTYGPSLVPPEDIVERIDELIPRDETTEVPLVWRARNVDAQVLIAARNEILRLRAQVEVLERVYYAALDWRNDMALPVDHIRTGKVGGRLLAAIYAVETIDKETPP